MYKYIRFKRIYDLMINHINIIIVIFIAVQQPHRERITWQLTPSTQPTRAHDF